MRLFEVGAEPVGVIAIGVAPRGVVAIGPLAVGVVAVGQLARGVLAVGQLALGVASFGQLAVGMWWASGQLALAPVGGAAQLRIAPFGKLYPLRRLRGDPDWWQRSLPSTWPRLVLSVLMVVGVGILVWFLAIDPVRDAVTGPNGVFPSPIGGAGG